MKWLLRIVVVLVVLIAAFLWLGYSQIDRLIKLGIEKGTPPVVQTSVTVAAVKLSPFSGTGTIEGFEIGNPKGFTGPRAMHIGKAEMALDTSSVSGDKIVIKHIRIAAPEINLEAGLGGTNLKHIAKNAQDFVSQQSTAAGKDSTAAPADDGKPKKSVKLQVDELLITGAKLSASAAGIVPGANANVTLPDIRLTNLGSGGAGISPAELIAQVLSRISTEAAKASANGSLKNLLQGSGVKIESDGLKDGVDGVKKLFRK
ncbi:hypothetical protein [Prosthecobacter sp.]|uniref:DUF748 domain-containing protein n=1 Tax=Prosthecobacter sp. TaxID=1965333 RepID=UPI002ABC3584|nr:hypothetical protein [Prosthecobacter sp.]MDZ4404549.1 hypothetical protein [Prosthecobacter sp.]